MTFFQGSIPITLIAAIGIQTAEIALQVGTIKDETLLCEVRVGTETLLKTIEFEMRIQACNAREPVSGDS